MPWRIFFCVTLATAPLFAFAQAPAPDPAAILKTFQVHPDFQIELAASEPAVFSPVDVEFDEHGRPFVMEMLGYPFPDDPGRIVELDDKDGDGNYETRTVFADGFAMANSLLPYNGGLLVVSPPDILFLKDTDGDDVADVREVVLTGVRVANPEDSINGLTYGLDNWIYAANGSNSANLKWPDSTAPPVPVREDDVRFNPRRRLIERTGRGALGFELGFDQWGRMFNTNNTHPLNHVVFPGRFIEGLPQPRYGTLNRLPDDVENGLVRIYPIGEQVTRVNHPEQSGYFSGACGPKVYTGGAFGPEFDGNLFVCDVVLNLVHRRILEPQGTTFIARRDNRPKQEFLASTDRAFRPVNLTIAPDGSLWVVDMHRVVIEHPEWIPDEIEATLDLNAGKDQGRLFRITPKGGLPRVTPRFDRNDLPAVVAQLDNPNSWWRLTAQRLLVQWQDRDAVPLLEQMVRESGFAPARAHALWTLDGLDALSDETLLAALDDGEPGVREQAVRLAGARMHGAIAEAVRQRATDAAPRVRMEAALALSAEPDWDFDTDGAALTAILDRDAGDRFARLALLPGMVRAPEQFMAELLRAPEETDEGHLAMMGLLAEGAARRLSAKSMAAVLQDGAEVLGDHEARLRAMVSGLASGLESGRKNELGNGDRGALAEALGPMLQTESLETLREVWRLAKALDVEHVPGQETVLARAREAVSNAKLEPRERVLNLRILEFAPFEERAELLYGLLDTRQPRELQREAIQQLDREGSRDVAQRLIDMWRTLGPETRTTAGNILLYKRHNHDLLLTALENRRISLGEMNLHLERRRALLQSRDADIRRRAEALFSDAGVVTRAQAIEAMRPALTLTGDAERGHQVFLDTCSRCHRVGDEGGDLAPNLTEIARKSKETLLHDILDPNAAVNPEFVSYTIETKSGEIVSGLIAEETDDAVTIRDANGGRTTVPRTKMREMLSGGLSLMPEELEAGLDPQAIADLLAFLQEPK